jgi:hypothetical protein
MLYVKPQNTHLQNSKYTFPSCLIKYSKQIILNYIIAGTFPVSVKMLAFGSLPLGVSSVLCLRNSYYLCGNPLQHVTPTSSSDSFIQTLRVKSMHFTSRHTLRKQPYGR